MERPGFFKFFLPEKSKAQLKIPAAFIASVEEGSLPEKVFLRDRYRNLWTVNVEHVRENWFFGDGWAKFVKDNRVTSCDFLVFDYFLVGLFDFKIFGPSATEKEGAGAFFSKGMKDHGQVSEKEAEEVEGENNNDDSQGHDCVYKELKTESEANGGDDGETKDTDYFPSEDNECDDEVEEVNKANTIGNSYGKRTSSVPKYYGIEFFKSGLAPQPMNPYFVARIMPKRKGNLFIPLELIKDHNLQLPNPEMILIDPRGREFRGKYREWADGRIFYTGGWKTLCSINFVENEDVCICEFMQGHRGLYLNVSFIRANGNGR